MKRYSYDWDVWNPRTGKIKVTYASDNAKKRTERFVNWINELQTKAALLNAEFVYECLVSCKVWLVGGDVVRFIRRQLLIK